MSYELMLNGEKVIVCPLNQSNVKSYLSTYKRASAFSEIYEMMPEVDIAIIEEYRRKGYAFEAAKILLENIFEKESVECIIWSAFSSNIASCRIAEKLGGIVVEGKNLIVEAMQAAGLKMDSVNDKEIPKTVTYEIKGIVVST